MDELIESEDSCVYCSKYLYGLNDFNKKMHYNTCKVRKLVESNYCSPSSSQNSNELDDYLLIGDNCTYCFKSFKDFKSDFNKRIHLKCCKIKKETFEHRNSLNKLQQSQSDDQQHNQSQTFHSQSLTSTSTPLPSNMSESCIFCTKPLANLNEFNKKMHLENCKIRKSIEGNFSTPKSKQKDENLIKLSLELGSQCMYCSKSFVNLSDFNKKLHFEHCKSKKKKLNLSLNNSNNNNNNNNSINTTQNNQNQTSTYNQQNSILLVNNNCPSTPTSISSNHSQIQQLTNPSSQSQPSSSSSSTSPSSSSQTQSSHNKLDFGDNCLYCARSLMNLSNFNKKVHIETCKIKQIKKATASQLKQSNKTIRKRANTNGLTSSNKKEKMVPNEFCATQIITTLDLSNTNGLNTNVNGTGSNQVSNSTQYETANATILSLNALDNATLHQISLAAANQANNQISLNNTSTHTLQITLDPNTNRIYI